MAELASHLRPTKKPFLQKAVIFVFFALVLPFFPSQAPEFFTNHTIVSKIWELIHLLFFGIVISYGLFSRRNTETIPGKELGFKPNSPTSYVSEIIPGLEDIEEEEQDDGKMQRIWNNRFDASKLATVINRPLVLPVRSLNQQTEESYNKDKNCNVLPYPIPWRSRSFRMEARDEPSAPKIKSLNLPSPRSKRHSSSPSTSLSRENSEKKKALYKEITSRPPVPPPPPPPFLGHTYQRPFSNLKTKSTMRSFKNELKDVSRRPKPTRRTSLESSSSSSMPPSPITKSVRTFRQTEAQIEPPKKIFMDPRGEDIAEKVSIYSDSDNVSDSTDSDFDEEQKFEEYSDDEEMIEKPKFGMVKLEEKKTVSEQDVNEVDKKADEFIAKFREQIRLQRIESIKRSAGDSAVRSHKKIPRD